MNQPNKQDAKVALVTGAARRIGASIVQQLHHAGFNVVIHCHTSVKAAHDLALTLNQQRMDSAMVLPRELGQEEVASEMMACVNDWYGRLDVLVNNASVFIPDAQVLAKPTLWDTLFATNVKAPFYLSVAAQELLEQHQGIVVNITDIHASKALKGYGIYCQTKAALTMQTKSLASAFAPNVRVNAIAPGAIAWPLGVNALSPSAKKEIIAKTPLKQHGQPEYIAQAVMALVANPFITGQVIVVDGGRSSC